jgi:hypothetical protein
MKKILTTLFAGILIASISLNPVSAQDAEAQDAPGWTVGGVFGFPVYKSNYYTSATSFGLNIQAPFTIAAGPFNLGVGAFIGMTSGKNHLDAEESWVEVWPGVSMALNDLVALPVPIIVHAGVGLVPTGVGISAGAAAVLPIQAPVNISVGVNLANPLGNASDTFESPAQLLRLYVAAAYAL